MNNYQCTVCNHIYDQEHGDPLRGIAAGTSFEDLPSEWVCPVCGVSKAQFVEIIAEGCEPCAMEM